MNPDYRNFNSKARFPIRVNSLLLSTVYDKVRDKTDCLGSVSNRKQSPWPRDLFYTNQNKPNWSLSGLHQVRLTTRTTKQHWTIYREPSTSLELAEKSDVFCCTCRVAWEITSRGVWCDTCRVMCHVTRNQNYYGQNYWRMQTNRFTLTLMPLISRIDSFKCQAMRFSTNKMYLTSWFWKIWSQSFAGFLNFCLSLF